MKRLAALALVCAALAGCAAPSPATPTDRALVDELDPVAYPKGYKENPTKEDPLRDCGDETRSWRPTPGDADGPTVRAIREKGYLVVGVSQTALLLSRRDQVSGKMSGYEVDIANAIARALFGDRWEQSLRFVNMPTGKRLLSLDTQPNREVRARDATVEEVPQVDMVLADVTVTCTRVTQFGIAYSRPYLTTRSGLMVRDGFKEDAQGPDDLGGSVVCSGDQTTNSAEMIEIRDRQVVEGKTPLRPVTVQDTSECLPLLQRGLVDAIATDTVILAGFRLQDPGTRVLPYRDAEGTTAISLSGDPERRDLVRFTNGVLDRMRADNSLSRAHDTALSTMEDRSALPDEPYRD
ncbi:type 2 periplasmic-binding domain-containing protein [Actinokineospora pegani]|uniref:transporter substrate-binding domain-containing protein n=1 Tax=Actinokineospora pegani TaxID=2654637 RepID=UPI0012EADE6A|nr:transporter substrate-binding domain-containing protein [Actinokineospora pegani]